MYKQDEDVNLMHSENRARCRSKHDLITVRITSDLV